MADLNTSVRYVKGIGETKAKALSKLGIFTLRDLVMAFPRTYDDRTGIKTIAELEPGESCCVAAMVATEPRVSHIRKGLDVVRVKVVDAFKALNVIFFNQPYVKERLKVGETLVFFGKVSGKPGTPEMVNPIFEQEDVPGIVTRSIVPIYRLTAGISQNLMSRAAAAGLAACGDMMPDALPKTIQLRYKLPQSRFAYEKIHFPTSYEDIELARRRLIFEEFFILSCSLAMLRNRREVNSGAAMERADPEDFFRMLPFAPTGAQKRTVGEAFADMCRAVPMSRLVQGDVGSGKTMVAAACCWLAWKSGYQAAFMAPTEILAEQHVRTLTNMLSPHGVRVGLLTGGMKAKERREMLEKIKKGDVDLIIGTHALISQSVEYNKLGLVVADEQHRFGVEQRSSLARKGDAPHVLVMSATPIPRTLALIVYGDLDVSVIDELPPGRQTVDTFCVGEDKRERVYAFMRKQISEGRQVFVVCPEVEENEETGEGMKAVKEYARTLSDSVFPDLRVSFVHGKMKGKEKDEIMSAFVAGKTDILVATTVIEVGVDVPNATLMVVENADRFGLSQLHQLRGRVGRGNYKSYCVLFQGGGGETALERLKAMCRTNDGFKIAEEDLKLRGPGDFFGSRQSGLPQMKIMSFAADMVLLRNAQTAAKEVLQDDPGLKRPENDALRQSVELMIEKNTDTIN